MVTRVVQQDDWDCGLACACALYRYAPPPPPPQSQSSNAMTAWTLEQLAQHARIAPTQRSIWSIDLVLLLHDLGYIVSYYTSHVGINPALFRMPEYTSNAAEFRRDVQRVRQRFDEACELGIAIHERILLFADLRDMLVASPTTFLIANVDNRLISCAACADAAPLELLSRSTHREFIGHFVLVVGATADSVRVMNPSGVCPRDLCELRATEFDRARHQPGTDDDIIVVTLPSAANPPQQRHHT